MSIAIFHLLSKIPADAVFQCKTQVFSNTWAVYNSNGEVLGRLDTKDDFLPVVESQFFNLENHCWTARFEDGRFADVKPSRDAFVYVPVKQ